MILFYITLKVYTKLFTLSTSSRYNDPILLSTIYNSQYVITLDELPATLYGSPTVLLGDLNSDQAVDALDLALIKTYLLKIDTPDINLTAADVNKDSAVDALDLALLKSYLLHIVKSF